VIRAVLDRSVAVLLGLTIVGFAGLWRLTSWNLEATRLASTATTTVEEQRALELGFILPYLLSPAAATLLVAALIGLPIVVGVRYAAIVRARRAPVAPTS
jgi:uncharacterized integral membrane protein